MLIESNKRHKPRAGGYKEKCPIWAKPVPVQRLGIGQTYGTFIMCPIHEGDRTLLRCPMPVSHA